MERVLDGSISCLASAGCNGIILRDLTIICMDNSSTRSMFTVQGSTFTSKNVSFNRCDSRTDGGIVKSYDGATIFITSSRFENIYSFGFGGAVAVLGSQAFISNTQFFNCSSLRGGGAIWMSIFECYGSEKIEDTVVFIDNTSSFVSCHSPGPGGSILATPDSTTPLGQASDSFAEKVTKNLVASLLLFLKDTKFLNSGSEREGGALAVSSVLAHVEAVNCTFVSCSSALVGGAVYAGDQAQVNLSANLFLGNTALGIGGGALYSQNARMAIANNTSKNNRAPAGGGGMLFWDGDAMPVFPQLCTYSTSSWPTYSLLVGGVSALACGYKHARRTFGDNHLDVVSRHLCGPENSAMYGGCIASDSKALSVLDVPTPGSFAGLPFSIHALKKDAYNQTISSDSESIVQVFQYTQSLQSTFGALKISGNSIARFSSGDITLILNINPIFSFVDPYAGQSPLQYETELYLIGADSQTRTASTLRSVPVRVPFHTGRSVCPKGYVLSFDQQGSACVNCSAGCVFCKSGTYSINPLAPDPASPSFAPSCLNCPVGGDCSLGGYDVRFEVGDWVESDFAYLLVSCPPGYQRIAVSPTSKLSADHDFQQCKQCLAGQYIIRPNVDTCQTCPEGEQI